MNRDESLNRLKEPWDVLIVGGGITGAGVLHRAARSGLKALLIEQRDFGWGTSSRSGKMVHGGLRYLVQGQVKITWQAVRERQRLLREYAGLVEPMGFLFPLPVSRRRLRRIIGAGLTVYDLMAGRLDHKFLFRSTFAGLAPGLEAERLWGGFNFTDAVTDDARLVLRLIEEAGEFGGEAVNYLAAKDFVRNRTGRVVGVIVQDAETGQSFEIRAKVVINTTGIWTDVLRARLGRSARLRRLRGSHLVVPGWRLPLGQAVSIFHPRDRRTLYMLPWEGATLIGTTDLDHAASVDDEPTITIEEGRYLLEAVNDWFPSAGLTGRDVIATFSGIRPVVDTGRKDPDKASRDHAVWDDDGLITLTGGKLTTFDVLAKQGLKAAAKHLGRVVGTPATTAELESRWMTAWESVRKLGPRLTRRLIGRYGSGWLESLGPRAERGLTTIGNTDFLWAELEWAARNEAVVHLDDLLLRRTRLGLLLPQGGRAILDRAAETAQAALGWDDARREQEVEAYQKLWRRAYSPELLR